MGSIAEGTKVGLTNEADCMVFFRDLCKDLLLKDAQTIVDKSKKDVFRKHNFDLFDIFARFAPAVKKAIGAIKEAHPLIHLQWDEECDNKNCKEQTNSSHLKRYFM